MVTTSTVTDETASEPSYATDEDAEDLEKIEVHVHVHRGDSEATKARKKRPPPPPVLTGDLFDWKEHYEQFCKLPAPPRRKPATFRAECEACGTRVGLFARSCSSCQAPQPRHALGRLIAAIGFVSVAVVFSLCAHVLGDSVAEHRNPEPVGGYQEYPDVIEIRTTPSPFNYDPYSAEHTTISSDRTLTR